MAGFPYVIFFGAPDDHVVFWRILHARRDIPETLRSSDLPELPQA